LLFFDEELYPAGQCTFFNALFRPDGEVLFFASPKKSTQKKGDPDGLPAMRVPCASRENRRSRNSLTLKQGASLPRFSLRCSAAPDGFERQNRKPETSTRFPLALTEYRSRSGTKARTLSEAGLPAELCAPPDGRGTQGIGACR